MSEHHTCHLAYDIHKYVNIGVKRSVSTSGMQPTSYIFYKIVFRAKDSNILIPHFSIVFLRISFVYFIVLGTLLNDKLGLWHFLWYSVIVWDKPPCYFKFEKKVFCNDPTICIWMSLSPFSYRVFILTIVLLHYLYCCSISNNKTN